MLVLRHHFDAVSVSDILGLLVGDGALCPAIGNVDLRFLFEPFGRRDADSITLDAVPSSLNGHTLKIRYW